MPLLLPLLHPLTTLPCCTPCVCLPPCLAQILVLLQHQAHCRSLSCCHWPCAWTSPLPPAWLQEASSRYHCRSPSRCPCRQPGSRKAPGRLQCAWTSPLPPAWLQEALGPDSTSQALASPHLPRSAYSSTSVSLPVAVSALCSASVPFPVAVSALCSASVPFPVAVSASCSTSVSCLAAVFALCSAYATPGGGSGGPLSWAHSTGHLPRPLFFSKEGPVPRPVALLVDCLERFARHSAALAPSAPLCFWRSSLEPSPALVRINLFQGGPGTHLRSAHRPRALL